MPRTIRNEFDKKLTDILYNIIARKIQDLKLLSVIKQIIYSTQGKKGQPIRELYIANICQHIFKRIGSICKT